MNYTGQMNHKVTIGIPVYNGEKFIRKALDSVLTQTYSDFELIISDNASRDSTPNICEEYAKKDKRIRYFRQEKNRDIMWNFRFILEQATSNYFMWLAVDDHIHSTFIEKNAKILDFNNNVVVSMGKVQSYSLESEVHEIDSIDRLFGNFIKKLRFRLKPIGPYSISGAYDKKVRKFLKGSTTSIIYGLHRTEVLRKSIIQELFIGDDWAIILNILKHGDTYVLEEILTNVYDRGLSRKGLINLAYNYNHSFFGTVFPFYFFTKWCIRNLGIIIFLKNIDCFLQLNLAQEFFLVLDLTRILIHKLNRK